MHPDHEPHSPIATYSQVLIRLHDDEREQS
jgi:hypothetical protein